LRVRAMGKVDPILEAFGRVISEVYWVENLGEAEEKLASFLENLDDDIREVLLERRRRICSDPESVLEAARLEAVALEVGGEDELLARFLMARSMLATLYLAQCTPGWQRMKPREKARILAPMYRASKALELAAQNLPGIDEERLGEAEKMIEEAAKRMDREGLLDELRSYIESVIAVLGVRDEG